MQTCFGIQQEKAYRGLFSTLNYQKAIEKSEKVVFGALHEVQQVETGSA